MVLATAMETMAATDMGSLAKFPGEIRNTIYKFALLDSSLLTRRHDAFCHYAAKTASHVPIPPYALTTQGGDSNLPVCPCTRRHGLGLLQTCKKIHEEASSIFWCFNEFVFRDNTDFLQCVTRNTSPATRQRIARIVVLGPVIYPRDHGVYPFPLWTKAALSREVWDVLLTCSGMRMLRIDPTYLYMLGFQMRQIHVCLPMLTELQACTLRSRPYKAPPDAVPGLPPAVRRLPAIYLLSSLDVEFATLGHESDAMKAEVVAQMESEDAWDILNTALPGEITIAMDIPPPSATSPDPAFLEEGEEGEGSDFPHEKLAKYIRTPAEKNVCEDGDPDDVVELYDCECMVEIIGMPGSVTERARNAARVELNERMRMNGGAELPDAVIQGRFWRRVGQRMRLELLAATLPITIYLIAGGIL